MDFFSNNLCFYAQLNVIDNLQVIKVDRSILYFIHVELNENHKLHIVDGVAKIETDDNVL